MEILEIIENATTIILNLLLIYTAIQKLRK